MRSIAVVGAPTLTTTDDLSDQQAEWLSLIVFHNQ